MMTELDTADSAPTSWDPDQYLKFANARVRAALDLLARVPLAAPRVVCDLGCGTGNVTRILSQRWPHAEIFGIDNSTDMLEAAASEPSAVRWEHGDVATWKAAQPADLIYSNATLHWLGGHEALFPRLLDNLAPGGVLAVQMPQSWHAPSHQLMRQVLATAGAGGGPLGDAALRSFYDQPPVLDPEAYYRMLAGRARSVDLWTSEYLQILRGAEPILEWVSGTGLRPILDALSDDDRERFLDAYRQGLRQAYPRGEDGCTLYPFRRLFIVACI
jgi:trans-aconitate 2-methyltransferase